MNITSPEKITKLGEEIYEKNKPIFEKEYLGKFVAIDVNTGEYFIADSPEEASKKAKDKYPDAISFLTKIGNDRGVFTLRSNRGSNDCWPFLFGIACH